MPITPLLHCSVVTPERTLCRQETDFVVVTLEDGELGIAPGHTPLVARLGCGELRIRGEEGLARFYVEGGFVEVARGEVCVLTPRAVPARELDEEVLREQLQAAQRRAAHTPEALSAREQAVLRSRAQLRVTRRARI